VVITAIKIQELGPAVTIFTKTFHLKGFLVTTQFLFYSTFKIFQVPSFSAFQSSPEVGKIMVYTNLISTFKNFPQLKTIEDSSLFFTKKFETCFE